MFIQVCNRFLCKKKRLLFLFSPDNNLLSFYVECKFVHQLEGVQDLPDGSMTIDFPRVKNRFQCFVLIMGVEQIPASQCFHDLFQGLPVKGKHAVFPGCIIIHVHGLLQQCFPGSVVIPLFARFQDDPLFRSADTVPLIKVVASFVSSGYALTLKEVPVTFTAECSRQTRKGERGSRFTSK